MENHVMIDIETLGTKPGCVVLSIGAIYFDIHTGKAIDKFYTVINIADSVRCGLTIDTETMRWWMKQSDQARDKVFSPKGHDLQDALIMFHNWFTQYAEEDKVHGIWGNSAAFDLGFLEAAFAKIGMEKPWSHKIERCYRTFRAMFPILELNAEKDEEKAHDPIYDCEYQIANLVNIYLCLNSRGAL